jgi:hypothetical protein
MNRKFYPDPDDPLNVVSLRTPAAVSVDREHSRVTVSRPGRPRNNKTYFATDATMKRIDRLVSGHYWPSREWLPGGETVAS